jgi:hypothetical protein
LLLLAQLDATSTIGDIVWRLILTGIGQGLFQSPNTRALMNAAPNDSHGEASGVLTTGRVVGQSLSIALAGAMFAGLGGTAAGHALADAASGGLTGADVGALQQTFPGRAHGLSRGRCDRRLHRARSRRRGRAATREGDSGRSLLIARYYPHTGTHASGQLGAVE